MTQTIDRTPVWYIVAVTASTLICATLILIVKLYYNSADKSISMHRKRFITRLQESDSQMSQLIEMTAQYLENVCRIGAYAQADREWRHQQLRSRPSSVCGGGAYASIDSTNMTRNDDMLAKKYRMQEALPAGTLHVTPTVILRTNSMKDVRAAAKVVSSTCTEEKCHDDLCPHHGERNRALTRLNPDVGLHGNYGAPDQDYPTSPSSQMSVFSYSLPRPPRQ